MTSGVEQSVATGDISTSEPDLPSNFSYTRRLLRRHASNSVGGMAGIAPIPRSTSLLTSTPCCTSTSDLNAVVLPPLRALPCFSSHSVASSTSADVPEFRERAGSSPIPISWGTAADEPPSSDDRALGKAAHVAKNSYVSDKGMVTSHAGFCFQTERPLRSSATPAPPASAQNISMLRNSGPQTLEPAPSVVGRHADPVSNRHLASQTPVILPPFLREVSAVRSYRGESRFQSHFTYPCGSANGLLHPGPSSEFSRPLDYERPDSRSEIRAQTESQRVLEYPGLRSPPRSSHAAHVPENCSRQISAPCQSTYLRPRGPRRSLLAEERASADRIPINPYLRARRRPLLAEERAVSSCARVPDNAVNRRPLLADEQPLRSVQEDQIKSRTQGRDHGTHPSTSSCLPDKEHSNSISSGLSRVRHLSAPHPLAERSISVASVAAGESIFRRDNLLREQSALPSSGDKFLPVTSFRVSRSEPEVDSCPALCSINDTSSFSPGCSRVCTDTRGGFGDGVLVRPSSSRVSIGLLVGDSETSRSSEALRRSNASAAVDAYCPSRIVASSGIEKRKRRKPRKRRIIGVVPVPREQRVFVVCKRCNTKNHVRRLTCQSCSATKTEMRMNHAMQVSDQTNLDGKNVSAI